MTEVKLELFDKKFVHFMWNDSLIGKKGFFADYIDTLIARVNINIRGDIDAGQVFGTCSHGIDSFPFAVNNTCDRYRFFYYDPLYEYKVAWNQGKRVEVCDFIGISRAWIEVPADWKWEENYEYRVKPDSKMWTAAFNDEGVISVMHSSDWNKNKGRQLIEGTREKCENFVIKNYCNKCPHHAACVGHKCTVNLDMWYCQGFRELKPVPACTAIAKVCGTCKHKDLPYSCTPCKECMEDDVDSGEKSMWEPKEVKKRHMTNRELAKWLAQGNGECMCDDISMTCWRYVYSEADKPVRDGVKIRGWNETEWSDPLVEE